MTTAFTRVRRLIHTHFPELSMREQSSRHRPYRELLIDTFHLEAREDYETQRRQIDSLVAGLPGVSTEWLGAELNVKVMRRASAPQLPQQA